MSASEQGPNAHTVPSDARPCLPKQIARRGRSSGVTFGRSAPAGVRDVERVRVLGEVLADAHAAACVAAGANVNESTSAALLVPAG